MGTSDDPDDADYVIPGNDDAIRAIKLISQTIANAVVEGRQGEDAPELEAEVQAAEGGAVSETEAAAADAE